MEINLDSGFQQAPQLGGLSPCDTMTGSMKLNFFNTPQGQG